MSHFDVALLYLFAAFVTGVNGLLTLLNLKLYTEVFKEKAQRGRQP